MRCRWPGIPSWLSPVSFLATQCSGLLAQFVLSFYRVWVGTCFVSPREGGENMKALQLPQAILGTVGAQETHMDPLTAQSILDIPGGFCGSLL